VFDDLASGRAPHALVAQDIGECSVEGADSVWYTNDERVQAVRHDAARMCALALKRVELPADHAFELF